MNKLIGDNDAMRRSMGHFEHEGLFSIALNDMLKKDIMIALFKAMGITGEGTIYQNSKDGFCFTGYLHSCGFISETVKQTRGYPNYEKTIYSRDAKPLKKAAIILGYNNIVIACNRWMGLEDEYDGVVLQVLSIPNDSNANVSASLDSTVKRPPERLSEAIAHPKYFTLLTQVYLELNKAAQGERMKRWQKLMISYVEMEYPPAQKQRWFSGQSLIPAQELVEIIAKKTIITIPEFCATIVKLFPDLELYTENILATHQVCQKEFEEAVAEKNSNQSEVYNWCVSEGLDFLIPILEGQGFDTLEDITDVTIGDLKDMGVTKLGHQKKIMRSINKLSGTNN